MNKLLERIVDTFWYNLGRVPEEEFYIDEHVERGNCQVVERLLLSDPSLANHRDGFGTPLLSLAVQDRQHKVTALLLRVGCDVNAVDAEGATALHHAVDEDDSRIFRLLLEYGASPEIADENGDIALDWAESSKRECIRKIIKLCAARKPPGPKR